MDINGIHKGKTAIICGGSSFPEDTEHLHSCLFNSDDIVSIGTNYWPTFEVCYRSHWVVVQDSQYFLDYIDYYNYNNILTAYHYNCNVSKKTLEDHGIDLPWGRDREPSDYFRGNLFYCHTVPILAINLAAFMGCENILLYGFDLNGRYNSKWPLIKSEIKDYEQRLSIRNRHNTTKQIKDAIVKLKFKYNINIYNLNPKNNTPVPFISIYDALDKKFFDTSKFYNGIKKYEDNTIDWSQSAMSICNKIEDLYVDESDYTGKEGACTTLNNRFLKIWEARVDTSFNRLTDKQLRQSIPGQILLLNNTGCWVKTGSGVIFLLKAQFPGNNKPRVKARFKVGDIFDVKKK